MIEPLFGATIFTKLDLRNAYHLVRIRAGDEWKTGSNTPLGHFECLVMTNQRPPLYSVLVSEFFLTVFVFVYLDDILIYSVDLQQHQRHLRVENKLYVKAEKSEFHVTSVQFLGLIIERGDEDPSKTMFLWIPEAERTFHLVAMQLPSQYTMHHA